MFNHEGEGFDAFKQEFKTKADEAFELYEIFYAKLQASPAYKSLSSDKVYDLFYEICWSVNEVFNEEKKLKNQLGTSALDSPDYIA